MNKLNIFSFFSGSGFLDLGFELNGYSIELVNEFSSSFINAYKYSRKQMGLKVPKYGYSNIDINEYLEKRSEELLHYITDARQGDNLVGFIGGPPCPDFSVAGKQRGRYGDNGKLSLSYVQLIISQQPDFFLFENVKGLWKTAKHREFYEELKHRRKFALSLGILAYRQAHFNLREKITRKLLSGQMTINDIKENDLVLNVDQKGVDMKIGIDIASLAYKKQVNQIVLIAGDSDFVPAAKLARREGIDFVLDPLGGNIKDSLFEHIDGLRTCDSKFRDNK